MSGNFDKVNSNMTQGGSIPDSTCRVNLHPISQNQNEELANNILAFNENNNNNENNTHQELQKENENEIQVNNTQEKASEKPIENPHAKEIRIYCVLYSLLNILISFFDFITYLILPVIRLGWYTIVVGCGVFCSVCTQFDIETPENFTVVPSREDDIIAYSEEGGPCSKTSGQCFSQLTICFARYFCCACVLWEHCVLTFQVAYRKAKEKFKENPVEEVDNIEEIQIGDGVPVNQVSAYQKGGFEGRVEVNDSERRINFSDLPGKIIE